MKTTKPAVILLALVLLTAAAAKPAEAMVKPKISNTRTASCLVKITSDPAVMPLSDIVIDYLLHSSGVAGKAAREVLNISPDQASDLFTIEDLAHYSSGGSGIPPKPSRRGTRTSEFFPDPRLEGYSEEYEEFEEYEVFDPMVEEAVKPAPSRRYRIPAFPAASKIVRKPKPTPSGRPTTRRTTPAASTTSTAEQTYLLKLQVGLGDEDEPIKPAAEEFMGALIENLRRALSIAFDDYRNKIRGQQDLASEEADRAERKLVSMQNELREISGSRNLSRSVILSNISNLRRQLQDIIMHQASQEIYIQATTDQIAETRKKVAEQLRNDPITIELKGIVDIHTKSLENIQELVKEGAVSSAGVEVEEVLEKLARARIELAKRREQISKSAGGNKLDRLNTELAEYSLNMAQNKFSIFNLEKQIAEAQDFLAKADTYEVLSLKADIAKQGLQEALLWRERIERKTRSIQPPAVTVLGGS